MIPDASLRRAEYIGIPGNSLNRIAVDLPEKPSAAVLRIVAEPHRYGWADSCQFPGQEWNWKLTGSFLKYRLWIDGVLVGAGPVRGMDDTVLPWHEYNVADLLRAGPNVVAVQARSENRGFALALDLSFPDGSSQTVLTGADWKQLDANALHAPIDWRHPLPQCGEPSPGEFHENIDGSRYPMAWRRVDFNDAEWPKAAVNGPVGDRAMEDRPAQNYALATVKPVAVRALGPGDYQVDFGRELVAGVTLRSRAAGRPRLRLGEELMGDDRRVRFMMRTGNNYQETWTFPEHGGELSHFGLRAFRYAEILNYPGELTADDLSAVTVTAPFDWADSSFSCDDTGLDTVWRFCKNTIAWTNQDLYTDCPSRERMAYEADTYIAMRSHFAVEGNPEVARRTVEYHFTHPTWPCEWRLFLIPVVYEYALHTGDLELVRRRYADLVHDWTYHDLLDNGLVKTFPMRIIVDWPMPFRDGYVFGEYEAVPIAFVHYDLVLLGRIAGWLGKDHDRVRWEAMAAEVKDAFNARLFDPGLGRYRDHGAMTPETVHGAFHDSLFPLRFGLVPEEHIPGVLDFLVERGMACSVYGAQFYLDALFDHGRADDAVRLMTSSGRHSWLGMMAQGATATMEAWDTVQKPNASFAHPWAASPANAVARGVFGLRPTEPGWTAYDFNPNPGPLKRGKLTIPTPRGRLAASFTRANDGTLETACDFVE